VLSLVRMTEDPTLDEIIDAFIAGHSSFQRFSRDLEHYFSRFPEQREGALRRLDAMRTAGELPEAIHGLIVQEIERSTGGDLTPPIEDGEEARDSGAAETLEEEPDLPRDPSDSPALAGLTRPRHAAAHRAEIESVHVRSPPPAPPRLSKPAPATPPDIGTVVGDRYRLMALLGRGGMSLVFAAEDLQRQGSGFGAASVCVKLLAPEYAAREDARRTLEREAQLLGRLNHPGIVRLLDLHKDGPWPFLVMELLNGERLRDVLLRQGATPMAPGRAMAMLRELVEILAYLHAHRIVHRDIKPANIFVTVAGRIRLIDFDLAADVGRFEDSGYLASKSWTPLYASPEMLAGRSPDPRDDVYALGCVTYEMLTARHPWDKLPADIAARRNLKAKRPGGLSRARWEVLRRVLSFNAADRPQDATAFLAEFFPRGSPQRMSPWATAAVLVGIAALVAWFIFQPGPRETEPLPRADAPAPRVEAPVAGLPPLEGDPRPGDEEAPAEPPETRDEPDWVASTPVDEPPPAAIFVPDLPDAPDEATGEAADVEEAPDLTAEEASPPPVEAPAPAAAPAPPPAPVNLALPASSFRVMEDGGALRVRLRRPAGYQGTLRVLWRTQDETAQHEQDYVGSPAWRLAEVPPGVDELLILIPIVDDSIPGPDLTFYLELSRATGGPPVGTPARALVTIVDDD
jgi:aminoglycoside phosphotransferase (APT) family kinase protein